jgi:hypothetical protein
MSRRTLCFDVVLYALFTLWELLFQPKSYPLRAPRALSTCHSRAAATDVSPPLQWRVGVHQSPSRKATTERIQDTASAVPKSGQNSEF